jgi:aminopeptidase N
MLLDRLQHASTPGQRITYYRSYVANASTAKSHEVLKQMLEQGSTGPALRAKDKFDIVTRLIILSDPEAPKLLADLEKAETSDDAKRYAYAARAAFATKETKEKYWSDFTTNKTISESWIESAVVPFNTLTQADRTLPYLERALAELPNLKRSRKIFFINNWLSAWIAGQRSEQALAVVNKFLADNPKLDNDLRLKVLENVDLIERAVRIRAKFAK